MLEQLLESLDKEVYTAEMLESIQTQFNEAVQAKAEEMTEEKLTEALAEKDKEIEAKAKELEENAEKFISESIEQKTKELEEKAEEFVDKKLEEINENLDSFLDKVIADFITEAKGKLDESLKSAKADMIIESYEAMLTAGSIDLMKIVEAKNTDSIESKLAESIEKYDALMCENLELQKEKTKLLKKGIISEMKEGLSLVESKKFEKLAEMVSYSQDEEFVNKLEVIKESVKGVSDKEIMNENVKEPEVKVESKSAKSSTDFSHLV